MENLKKKSTFWKFFQFIMVMSAIVSWAGYWLGWFDGIIASIKEHLTIEGVDTIEDPLGI
jgi:hypothetical protein